MTPFRAARTALGWTIAQTAEALKRSWRHTKDMDTGDKTAPDHTLALMETWAASWFPAKHRPQPAARAKAVGE